MDLYSKSIEELSKQVSNMEDKVKSDDGECFPSYYIAYALAPLIVWVALYHWKPNCCCKEQINPRAPKQVDNKKMLMWVAALTAALYGAIYMYCKRQKQQS